MHPSACTPKHQASFPAPSNHHASAAAHVFVCFPSTGTKVAGCRVQSATHAHDGVGGAKFVSISHLQQDHTTYTCQFLQHSQKKKKNGDHKFNV